MEQNVFFLKSCDFFINCFGIVNGSESSLGLKNLVRIIERIALKWYLYSTTSNQNRIRVTSESSLNRTRIVS